MVHKFVCFLFAQAISFLFLRIKQAKMRIILIVLSLTFFTSSKTLAQQSSGDPIMVSYQAALQQYKSASYAMAYQAFVNLDELIEDENSLLAINTDYYKALCAVHLYNNDAVFLLKSFMTDYPNSTLFYEACRSLADLYFSKRAYKEALYYYELIDISQIRIKYRANYKFQYAYSLLAEEELKKAASIFHDLLSNKNEYQNKSKYYFGYIAYAEGNLATAKRHFEDLLKMDLFVDEIPLYIAQIYHQQKEYNLLLIFCLPYVDSITTATAEMYKLIAEAYYHTKYYKKAIYFLNDKFLAEKNNLDDLGYYILGQSYYRSDEFSLASAAFNKIVEAEDSLAQNTYYYLADCYLELGDKKSAQNAFESASNFTFNNAITEHANFNFAKLCYELGYPYADPTMILQDFINDFPESEYLDEAYSYLINAFLTHKDYSRAIKSMETSGLENIRLQQAYQEVSYYRAVQLFNDRNYTNAISHFNKSLLYTHNNNYEALASYWKGESFYRLENFKESIGAYKEFQNSALASSMPEFKSASYHIAYANFKLWNFNKSLKAFETFTANVASKDTRLHDAFSRMGDAHYMLKDYTRAIHNYNKAIELWGVDSDYAAYQIALAYHQMDKHEKVVEHLKDFSTQYASSTYKDDALYRIGESSIKLNNPDAAVKSFKAIEELYPTSVFITDARMKVGLVLYNNEQYEESIAEFKRLVADYPATSTAREAINNVRSLYVDLGDVTPYVSWLETLSFVNVSTSALDSTSYESAELQYLKGFYAKSFSGFQSYLENYPDGNFKLSAHYYYAKSAVEIDSIDKALASYEIVNSYNSNKYSHSSIKQTAILYQSKQQFGKALANFEKLDLIAETVEQQLFAKQGLMDCYIKLGEYEKAIEQAQLVLNSGRVDESLLLELNTFIARAAFANLDRTLAAEKYLIVEAECQGELKAEAMYHLAYLAFYNGDYETSKGIIFEQSRLLPLYKKWLGKSFIVLAHNYWVEEDVFQATHTLDQLLLNIKDEAVLKEAKALKAEIMAKENIEQNLSLQLDSSPVLESLPKTDSLKTTEE